MIDTIDAQDGIDAWAARRKIPKYVRAMSINLVISRLHDELSLKRRRARYWGVDRALLKEYKAICKRLVRACNAIETLLDSEELKTFQMPPLPEPVLRQWKEMITKEK